MTYTTDRRSVPEVIHVVTNCRLVDSSGNEWTYWRRNGCGLTPGFYVATPNPSQHGGPFGINTEFDGPFVSQSAAAKAASGANTAASR